MFFRFLLCSIELLSYSYCLLITYITIGKWIPIILWIALLARRWNTLTAPLQKSKTPLPLSNEVGCGWWPVMLKDGILVAEQFVTWKPKRSHDSQHFTLALTRLDGWLERPNLINWLVMSALSDFLQKSELESDGFRVNNVEEIPIPFSVSRWVIILGTKTQEQNVNIISMSILIMYPWYL